MSQVTLNERGYKDVELMQVAEQVLSKMAAETELFAAPVPALLILEEALLAFRNAATEAYYRDTRAILIRNQKRAELVYVLKELAKYVDTIANADPTIILAAGYAVRKPKTSYGGVVPKAGQLIARPEEVGSGRVKLKTQRWRGARMYQYQFRIKGHNVDWNTQLCSKSSCIIDGLESFREYEFRVSYIGIDPTPNYSDIISSYVL